MSSFRYRMNLPDFMASIHDANPARTVLIHRITRQKIEDDRNIIFADARHGYYIVAEFVKEDGDTEWSHGNFKIVNSRDFAIRRYIDDSMTEYYDSDEMYG